MDHQQRRVCSVYNCKNDVYKLIKVVDPPLTLNGLMTAIDGLAAPAHAILNSETSRISTL
jgi:hypothetical protein